MSDDARKPPDLEGEEHPGHPRDVDDVTEEERAAAEALAHALDRGTLPQSTAARDAFDEDAFAMASMLSYVGDRGALTDERHDAILAEVLRGRPLAPGPTNAAESGRHRWWRWAMPAAALLTIVVLVVLRPWTESTPTMATALPTPDPTLLQAQAAVVSFGSAGRDAAEPPEAADGTAPGSLEDAADALSGAPPRGTASTAPRGSVDPQALAVAMARYRDAMYSALEDRYAR